MIVYTCSEARQKFASLLDKASKTGYVLVRRKDGRLFSIRPERKGTSPLQVKGVKTKATTNDIIEAVRESRNR
jgi:antitoxin Phd